MSQFSENLKNARKAKNMTQLDLASKLFVTKQESASGSRVRVIPIPKPCTLISEILEISIDELMGKIMDKVENKNRSRKSQIQKIHLAGFFLGGIDYYLVNACFVLYLGAYQGYKKINQIESTVNVYFPIKGKLETYDYNTWSKYDVFISISEMGYIVFTKEKKSSFLKRFANESLLD